MYFLYRFSFLALPLFFVQCLYQQPHLYTCQKWSLNDRCPIKISTKYIFDFCWRQCRQFSCISRKIPWDNHLYLPISFILVSISKLIRQSFSYRNGASSFGIKQFVILLIERTDVFSCVSICRYFALERWGTLVQIFISFNYYQKFFSNFCSIIIRFLFWLSCLPGSLTFFMISLSLHLVKS